MDAHASRGVPQGGQGGFARVTRMTCPVSAKFPGFSGMPPLLSACSSLRYARLRLRWFLVLLRQSVVVFALIYIPYPRVRACGRATVF